MATIFYSWQTTAPGSTNRSFIELALEKALKELRAGFDVVARPELEEGVTGEAGIVSVADTLLERIARCEIYVADLSFMAPPTTNVEIVGGLPDFVKRALRSRVNVSLDWRRTPNPNVMFELGYALRVLDEGRIITVFNRASGDEQDLPFDIRHRRWPLSYEARESDQDKAERRKALAKDLASTISTIINVADPKNAPPKDRRCADGLERAVRGFLLSVLKPFVDDGLENTFMIKHALNPVSHRPDRAVLASLVQQFSAERLSASISHGGGDGPKQSEAIAAGLDRLASDCAMLLSRFSERDEKLLDVVRELEESAQMLAYVFKLPVRRGGWAELSELELGWLVDFLGLLVWARRRAAEFGAVQLLEPA